MWPYLKVSKRTGGEIIIPYSGLFSRRLYFANFARAEPILENQNREKMWRRRGSVSPFVKLLFANNRLFAKYKRLENESTAGADASVEAIPHACLAYTVAYSLC